MVGRRGENFGVEKRREKKIYVGKEDGIFVHPENGLNGLMQLVHWWLPVHSSRGRRGCRLDLEI